MTAREALQHEWIAGKDASSHNGVLDWLKSYQYDTKLQEILVNAILNEMDAEKQMLLAQELLTMNREQSQADGRVFVDYLLLHSQIDTLPRRTNKEYQQPMNEISDYTETIPQNKSQTYFDGISWDNLNGIDVDDVLDEIEAKEQELGVDIEGGRISIGRFRAIMDKADKKYDVNRIVEDLNDGTGYIVLKDIATYTNKIYTMTAVFVHE